MFPPRETPPGEKNMERVKLGANTVLVSILKEMGTNIDMFKMNDWEIMDEIIRRIHLQKLESQRMRSTVKKLQREMASLAQMSISDLLRRKD